jgi:glutamate carboxypeptidase
VVDGRTHLRGRLGPGPARVLLVGHHDTVHPIGTLARTPWSVVDGIARGPGCFDMKAGLVVMFHALASLPDRDGVAIVISGDEEVGSPTARGLLAETAAGCRAALVAEPSADGGALKIARKGIGQYEITIRGRSAHAGLEPRLGVNATVELAHQILAIAGLATENTTVTPTVVCAGDTVNTVPDKALVYVDARAVTVAEQQRVDEAITGLGARLPGVRLEVRRLVGSPPLEAAASADLFRLAVEVAAARGLPAPVGTAVGGASDGNFIASLGVPTLDGLGPVGGGAHTDREHVLVGELPRSASLLAGLVAELVHRTNPEP